MWIILFTGFRSYFHDRVRMSEGASVHARNPTSALSTQCVRKYYSLDCQYAPNINSGVFYNPWNQPQIFMFGAYH